MKNKNQIIVKKEKKTKCTQGNGVPPHLIGRWASASLFAFHLRLEVVISLGLNEQLFLAFT
jgi:hypothetical protein